jgi:hypothetical protein
MSWHGWQMHDRQTKETVGETLAVSPIPGRKQVALYFENGRLLAYFRSELDARAFMQWMDTATNQPEAKEETA